MDAVFDSQVHRVCYMGMQLIKQGPYECVLATAAMLTGMSLDVVRDTAEAAAGVVWRDRDLFDWDVFMRGMKAVCQVSGLPIDALLPTYRVVTPSSSVSILPCDIASLPDGRGTIHIRRLGATGAHIVAWENGRVYDPDNGIFESLADFQAHYTKWRIIQITILQEK